MRWHGIGGLLAVCALAACGGTDDQQQPQEEAGSMLIVAAVPLEEAANEYADYRRDTGFAVEVATTASIAAESPAATQDAAIRERSHAFARAVPGGEEAYILLMGDADSLDEGSLDKIPVPVVRGDSWWEYGDDPYADLDGDGIPDVSIGRLPFREPSQVRAYLARVREHEGSYLPGPWNKTLSAFAGEGGFGETIDGLLEMAAGWIFDEMSYDFDMSMTYAAESSDYHLPPALWDAEYVKRYEAGAVLMPYIGHTLGEVPCCEGSPPPRRGLLAYFSCGDGSFQDGGDFDPHQSLAERVLLREHGPVAAMGATSVSHPYGNSILPRELGHAILDLHEPTYGRALRVAQYNMVHRIDGLRQSLDAAAEPYVDEPLDQLVASHIALYNLLGDPAVPVRLPPAEVRIDDVEGGLHAGQTARVTGTVRSGAGVRPLGDGEIVMTLEVQRSFICHSTEIQDPDPNEVFLRIHAAANDKVVARGEGRVANTTFSVEIDVPPAGDLLPTEASYYLKAYAFNDEIDATGSRRVVLNGI